ncbi:MAG: 4-hydroxy-tetrahydrodipicolinate synthase [Clostridia bacterium]|nr:4-hydroxy-tetrahydrodipicolinate synthase [Clostridia bacterium]MDE7181635.1 4-hydroxy-tetrahydrodipicolinate synthase [Clostridia bacterium]
MTGFFNGIATAMITPFDKNGVNLEEFGKMIEYQIEGGTDALVVLGTTGEPATMTEAEKESVITYAVKKAAGRIKIIVGTGSNDTAKAVAASVRAEKLGADGVLAVTPYYNKCTQKGLYEYYKAICDAVKIPVIAYNVPSRTAVNVLPETAEKLASIPNMAGIKEASGNMAQVCETMRRIRGKMDLYSGEDFLNLPMLAIGGAGLISVASNIAPKLLKKMYTLVQENKLKEANEVQDFLLPFEDACFVEVNPIPVKAAYNMIGFNAGVPRSPLTELEDKNKQILLQAIKNAGLKTYD